MCLIDDDKEVIIEYKNIYDYEGDRQAWRNWTRLNNKIKREENSKNKVYRTEEEYWSQQIKEWGFML
ncbi:TPA: hypothetical protein PTV31_003199 [Clostridium botulinum]|nr:hypothetical protein [Clostridium botulinum]